MIRHIVNVFSSSCTCVILYIQTDSCSVRVKRSKRMTSFGVTIQMKPIWYDLGKKVKTHTSQRLKRPELISVSLA